MIFNMGRQDIDTEGDVIQHAPETHAGSLVVQGLAQQADLAPEEFVALMGSFTLGFCGDDKKGPHTRWSINPYVFDNTYFQELLLRDQSIINVTIGILWLIPMICTLSTSTIKG